MDSGKNGQVWRYRWHIAIIAVTLVAVLLLAVFTDVFQKSESVRQPLELLGSLIFLGALLATLSRVSRIVDTLNENSTDWRRRARRCATSATG